LQFGQAEIGVEPGEDMNYLRKSFDVVEFPYNKGLNPKIRLHGI
jgi:hypothetical protein